MLLAIDAGNTNTVFALFETGQEPAHAVPKATWRAATEPKRTADEYGLWLTQLMSLEGVKPDAVRAVIIATVVPATLFNLTNLAYRYFKVSPLVVEDPNVDLGIKVHVDHPEEVGADRLVNVAAAHARYGGPLVVVDFGTATTFDVVTADGGYGGGVIAPGINLSMQALHMAAARLPNVAVAQPPSVIGTNTIDAMRSGIFWGYVGLIEGLVSRIAAELGLQDVTVVATGGLAALFEKATSSIHRVDDTLTLGGLYLVAQRNGAA